MNLKPRAPTVLKSLYRDEEEARNNRLARRIGYHFPCLPESHESEQHGPMQSNPIISFFCLVSRLGRWWVSTRIHMYHVQMFRISGGNDKQGFPMKQGVLSANRVRLLLHKGVSCYRQRRRGERKRKSVRGCIVASDLAVLNLVVTKKGEQDIPGLTDAPVPRRLGPKRANNIRKLFNLGKVRGRVGSRKGNAGGRCR